MQGEVLEVEDEIEKLGIHYPSLIVAFGPSLDSLQDSMLVEENNILIMPTLGTALHCCFVSYFIFDIVYPPSARNMLLFLDSVLYELPQSVYLLQLSLSLTPSRKLYASDLQCFVDLNHGYVKFCMHIKIRFSKYVMHLSFIFPKHYDVKPWPTFNIQVPVILFLQINNNYVDACWQ